MMLFTYLCLVLSTTHLLADDVPELNYEPQPSVITRYLSPAIWPTNLVIPENSHLRGIPGTTKQEDRFPSAWMYDFIEYKKNISKYTAIALDYIINYKIQFQKEPDWPIWDTIWGTELSWVDYGVSYDTLCSGSINSVGSLVHQLLAMIPDGCPVFEGEKRDTSGIKFPFRMKSISLFDETPNRPLRILFGVHSNQGNTSELLLTGVFYLDLHDRVIELI